jgi:hypothetical protein
VGTVCGVVGGGGRTQAKHKRTWGSGHCKHGMYESPLGLRVMITSLVFYVILYFNELIDSFL